MAEAQTDMTDAGDPTEPRTTVTTVRWRPAPHIVGKNVAFLEALEDQKRLRAFNITDAEVRGITANEIEFVVTPRHLTFSSFGYVYQNDDFKSLLDTALEVLNPRITGLVPRFRSLTRWDFDGDYKTARIKAIRKIHRGDIPKDFSLYDIAVMVDGSVPDKQFDFQAEYGVVSGSEARPRLTKSIGQIVDDEAETGLGAGAWQDKIGVLPDIALFVESRWNNEQKIPPRVTGDWLADRIESAASEAEKLAMKLLALISGDQTGDQGTGE